MISNSEEDTKTFENLLEDKELRDKLSLLDKELYLIITHTNKVEHPS